MSGEKLQPLSLSQDALATYQDWLAWKRSIILRLEAKDIQDPARRKAVLLYKGGRPLQEIFATLEAADTTPTKEIKDPFEHAIAMLDKHFKPATNKFYERFLFRKIRQNGDSMDQFLVRLRKQVANCSYRDVDDALIDQIIEGTSNLDFQHKILEQRLQSLHKVIELGKLLETVKIQSTAMSSGKSPMEDSVARLQTGSSSRSSDAPRNAESARRCYRCGSLSHPGSDLSCPARESTCHKCDRVGHYASKCRSRIHTSRSSGDKPSSSASEKTPVSKEGADKSRSSKPKVRALGASQSRSSSDEDANCFQLSTKSISPNFSNRVLLRFGSTRVSPVIDSGADRNLIAARLWQELKRVGLEYKEVPIDARVYPYGRQEPIQFQGAVEFMVHSESASKMAKFFVVAPEEGDCETIVGRVLGVQLGILRIGEEKVAVRHLCVKQGPPTELGKLRGVQLSIPLDPAVPPLAQPCRRVPFALREKIRDHLAELLRDDIIEEVRDEPTPWVSPIVPVIKKNGTLRLCVDMRQANRAVQRENFPIPIFEELLADMADCEVFSKIDLRSAYNQVELSPPSRSITTFVTPDGIFRFKRLYCGIKCAPEMFQRLMASVVAGLSNVHVFFDDIIVFSKNRHDHELHVNALLKRLNDRGLSINLDKSTFGVPECEFLGHRLTKNRIRPNVSNAETIKSFKPPENQKDLQSFLGLMNYVARFIPNYSTLTAPLRELLDASPVALGAVLMQRRSTNGQPEILAFASRSLSKPEQNYSHIEKEALGIVWACERFRLYTLGKRFELYTDHKPLEILFGPRSKPNARIERWVLRLQSFDYAIKYIQGPKNLADPFSRLGHQEPSRYSYTPNVRVTVRALAALAVPKAISLDEFRHESDNDEEIRAVIEALRSDKPLPEAFLKVRFELTFVDNLLLRGDRLIPPKSLRNRILTQAHEGHPGIEVMKRRLRTKVWWPRVDIEATQFVKSCMSCLAVSRIDPPEPMCRSALPESPWEYLAIDHLGPLPNGKYILTVVDYFSRFLECQFVSSTSSKETIEHLYQIFARFGFPSRIKTDNGTAFKSAEFREFLEEYGVDQITSPPLWPRANGEVERQNRSILKRLKIATIEKRNLHVELAKYILLYHGTPHSTTGVSPAELMFRRKIRDKLPALSNPSPLYTEIRDADAEGKTAGKNFADNRRGLSGPKRELQVGDSVLLPASKSNKLSPTFDPEPYQIIATSPGEVTVRRGAQTLRRSSSAVKPVPRSSITVTENNHQDDGSTAFASSSEIASPSRPSLQGSPFKGFPNSNQATRCQEAPTATQTCTSSGRPVRPPSRLNL